MTGVFSIYKTFGAYLLRTLTVMYLLHQVTRSPEMIMMQETAQSVTLNELVQKFELK